MGKLRPLQQAFGKPAPPSVRFRDKLPDPFYNSAEWRSTRTRILKRDDYRCVAIIDGLICGDRAIIVDHIVRRRDGGTEDDRNLRSLCRDCDNRMKEKWDGTRRGS